MGIFNSTGGRRKVKNLQAALADFEQKFVREDAPSFFMGKLLRETIAGAPGTMAFAQAGDRTVVGVKTDKLRLSYTVSSDGRLGWIRSNTSVANYGKHVAEIVQTKTGRDYLQTTKFFYEADLRAGFRKELGRLNRIVGSGGNYVYQNPL